MNKGNKYLDCSYREEYRNNAGKHGEFHIQMIQIS